MLFCEREELGTSASVLESQTFAVGCFSSTKSQRVSVL
jgi:hypothetical protein